MNSKIFFLTCISFFTVALTASLEAVPMLAGECSDRRAENQSGYSTQTTTEQNRERDGLFSSQADGRSDNNMGNMEAARGSINQMQVGERNAGATPTAAPAQFQPESTTVTTSDGRKIEFPVPPVTFPDVPTDSIQERVSARQKQSDIRSFFAPNKAAEAYVKQQREQANAGTSSSSSSMKDVTSREPVPVAVAVKASSQFDSLKSEQSTDRVNENDENVVTAEAVAYPEVPDIEINNLDPQRQARELKLASAPPSAENSDEPQKPEKGEAFSLDTLASRAELDELRKQVELQKQVKAKATVEAKQEKITAEILVLQGKLANYTEQAKNAIRTTNEKVSEAFLKAATFAQQALEAKESGNDELSILCDRAATAANKLGELHQDSRSFFPDKEKIIKAYDKAVDGFDQAIENAKKGDASAADWKEVARLIMDDLTMDPNPGLNTPPRDDHMGRRLYRYGDFNQAIEFHKQAASLSAQEPSELTAVDELKINLLRKAGKAYELSERSETKLAAGRYDKAADSYSSKVPSTVTLESSTFHYLDAVSRIGDLYSFEARGNVIAFRDKGIDFDIEGLPWSVEVLFSRALEYNEDLVQRLTRDGSADSRLIQAAKAYYDLIKAGYEREEAITIFNLAGKARKAEVDWQNSGCVIM